MALFHVATIVPTKEQLITEWLPRQAWGPGSDAELTFVGAFRFDDPEGKVGMETFLVAAGGVIYQVPLTYRDAPLAGADDALIVQMEHSALGTRWVYDGLRDQALVTCLAATSLTGQGEALGLAEHEGRWYVVPAKVRITGGGWGRSRVAVDGFERVADHGASVHFRNDRFELVVHRTPAPGPRPPIGLVASSDGLAADVVVSEVIDSQA